jgi:hypothetical protein
MTSTRGAMAEDSAETAENPAPEYAESATQDVATTSTEMTTPNVDEEATPEGDSHPRAVTPVRQNRLSRLPTMLKKSPVAASASGTEQRPNKISAMKAMGHATVSNVKQLAHKTMTGANTVAKHTSALAQTVVTKHRQGNIEEMDSFDLTKSAFSEDSVLLESAETTGKDRDGGSSSTDEKEAPIPQSPGTMKATVSDAIQLAQKTMYDADTVVKHTSVLGNNGDIDAVEPQKITSGEDSVLLENADEVLDGGCSDTDEKATPIPQSPGTMKATVANVKQLAQKTLQGAHTVAKQAHTVMTKHRKENSGERDAVEPPKSASNEDSVLVESGETTDKDLDGGCGNTNKAAPIPQSPGTMKTTVSNVKQLAHKTMQGANTVAKHTRALAHTVVTKRRQEKNEDKHSVDATKSTSIEDSVLLENAETTDRDGGSSSADEKAVPFLQPPSPLEVQRSVETDASPNTVSTQAPSEAPYLPDLLGPPKRVKRTATRPVASATRAKGPTSSLEASSIVSSPNYDIVGILSNDTTILFVVLTGVATWSTCQQWEYVVVQHSSVTLPQSLVVLWLVVSFVSGHALAKITTLLKAALFRVEGHGSAVTDTASTRSGPLSSSVLPGQGAPQMIPDDLNATQLSHSQQVMSMLFGSKVRSDARHRAGRYAKKPRAARPRWMLGRRGVRPDHEPADDRDHDKITDREPRASADRRIFSGLRPATHSHTFGEDSSSSDEDPGEQRPHGRRKRLPNWVTNNDPTRDEHHSNDLMQYLLRMKYTGRPRRGTTKPMVVDNSAPHRSLASTQFTYADTVDSCLGSIDLSTAKADSFAEMVSPILRLRGMDVFLSDSPELDIANHPFLIQQGLRDVPTAIVNVVVSACQREHSQICMRCALLPTCSFDLWQTLWGNVLIYFECPSWFQSFDDVVVRTSHCHISYECLPAALT